MQEYEKFISLFNRIKKYLNTESDAATARGLEITPQALHKFKNNKRFPPELLIDFCLKHNLSVDEFYLGRDPGQSLVTEEFGPYSSEMTKQIERVKYIYQHGSDVQKDQLYACIGRVYDGILKKGGSGDTDNPDGRFLATGESQRRQEGTEAPARGKNKKQRPA